jgi:hypothetical protein
MIVIAQSDERTMIGPCRTWNIDPEDGAGD